jgi:hypothetical protein
MPYNDPDPTDPNMLVGVELPADPEATRDMAYVFAEEFARLGFNKRNLMRIFSRPFYAGAHRAYLELGEEEIEKIVDECLAIWGRIRFKDVDATNTTDLIQIEFPLEER